MKTLHQIIAAGILILALTACTAGSAVVTNTANVGAAQSTQIATSSSDASLDTGASTSATTTSGTASALAVLAENSETHEDPDDYIVDAAGAVTVTLQGSSITTGGAGVAVDGSTATITKAGTYIISGSLSDGQIIVNTKDKQTVTLILNGVNIHSSTSAPIYVMDADKTVILLAENTHNALSDSTSYTYDIPEDEEPSAALYSKSDLTIFGSGSLTVTASFRDGISSKDGLVIAGGKITVSAVDDGIRGKDYVVFKDGSIAVDARGDGLKADNAEDADKGFISIAGGLVKIASGGDSINAQTDVLVTGGELNLTAGGGSSSRTDDNISTKGIKGVASVVIDGGNFIIDTADDALHSNGSITINNGVFQLATGDDGMHADANLTINGGEIQIDRSYEGLESAVITINNGSFQVTATDDGINVAGGNDASGMNPSMGARPGGPGQDSFNYSGSYYLYIHGGTIVVDAQGDGLDINGAVEMTGGALLVSGPTEQMNGALDYDGGFKITGGFLVAAGSSGMAMAPDSSSSLASVLVYFSSTLPGGTLVHIQNDAGEDILTFAPARQFQSLAFASSELADGQTYTIYTGGSATGEQPGGLYLGGSYGGGTQFASFTVSSRITTVGTGGRMRRMP